MDNYGQLWITMENLGHGIAMYSPWVAHIEPPEGHGHLGASGSVTLISGLAGCCTSDEIGKGKG